MLKEKIMRFCIQSLLKLEEVKDSDYLRFKTMDDDEMDEEDHEALCNLFTTVSPSSLRILIFLRFLLHRFECISCRSPAVTDRENNRQPQGAALHERVL